MEDFGSSKKTLQGRRYKLEIHPSPKIIRCCEICNVENTLVGLDVLKGRYSSKMYRLEQNIYNSVNKSNIKIISI